MKTKSLLLPLVLALLALASAGTQTRAQNLVTNGSFELPTYAGDGDAYLDAGFTLPGWNPGNAPYGLFVEFGSHVDKSGLPISRYADGRQALCLNNMNGGARISQKIASVPGQNYLLSFAQADETMGAASASQLTVTINRNGSALVRTFSRTNDGPGYTVKTWQFTATDTTFKLIFTDSTPISEAGISPFLDAVSVVPDSLLAVGTNMNVPDGSGQFGQLPSGPGIGGSNLVFFGVAADGQQGIYGINVVLSDPIGGIPVDPWKVADTNTPIPGGSGNFTSFTGPSYDTPVDPMISGNNVVFGGMGAGGQQGIYSFPGDPLTPGDPYKIADLNTPIPEGEGNFTGFNINQPYAGNAAISGSNVVFFGTGAHSQGIYTARLGGPLTRIADSNTRRPSGLGYLCCYNSSPVHSAKPSISGNNVVFYAQSTDNVSGVYLSTGGTLSTVADTTTAIPGGVGNFGFFIGPSVFPEPLVSGSTVLFYGGGSFGESGMYVKTPQDPLKVVADVHTAIPGGSGNFTDFPEMSLSGDAVAFVGLGTDGQQGIYLALPSDPIRKVLDLIDMLDGKTITGFQLSRTGLDRDQNLLAFGASFSDGTQGLYTLNLFTGLRMNSVARTGPDLQLKFTSQPGHNYNVQAISDLANGTIRNVVANIPGAGLSTQVTISNAFLAPHEFYRIEQQ